MRWHELAFVAGKSKSAMIIIPSLLWLLPCEDDFFFFFRPTWNNINALTTMERK